MSKIAALSANVPVRPTPAPVRAPVAEASARDDAPEAAAARPLAPAPESQGFAAAALGVLIELQVHRTDPQPTHGRDDDHGHKPPVQDPPPVVQPPAPPVTQSAPYDPAAPQRTIAMISQRLADESIQDQARAMFAAQRAAERTSVIVSQGQAALTILQAMQQSYDAWQALPARGYSRTA